MILFHLLLYNYAFPQNAKNQPDIAVEWQSWDCFDIFPALLSFKFENNLEICDFFVTKPKESM